MNWYCCSMHCPAHWQCNVCYFHPKIWYQWPHILHLLDWYKWKKGNWLLGCHQSSCIILLSVNNKAVEAKGHTHNQELLYWWVQEAMNPETACWEPALSPQLHPDLMKATDQQQTLKKIVQRQQMGPQGKCQLLYSDQEE